VSYSAESSEAREFRQGLVDAGYSDGRDVVIEWRSANGDYARVSQLAADLVHGKVDVIVVGSTVAAQAVQRATSTIPIVMAAVADPVGSGLVASLAHPGGNVTGLAPMTVELSAKRLQLLKEAIPRLTRYGHLVYSQTAKLSLIAKGDRASVFTRHVLDSLNPLSLFREPPATAIDVGSGAGFPGIPLAIAWPGSTITLVESRERKAGFLERAVRDLGIRNVKVACLRLEDYGKTSRAIPQGAAFIRAVGGLPELLRALGPLCLPGSRWVYFLGAGTPAEATIGTLGAPGHGAAVEAGSLDGRLLVGTFGEGTPGGR
jgi:16S rRNA (guanine(527)-N(7))-methyltransferase RsmG